MDWSKIVSGLVSAAKVIVPMIVPGSAAAIEAGTDLLDTVREVVQEASLTPEQLSDLQVTESELEAAVNAHALRTENSLGDG